MKNINEISAKAPDAFDKSETKELFDKLQKQLFNLQNIFYAEGKYALLIVLQGMDTSGKDGIIRHVFSHVNPQGCDVKSFKIPTEEERSHDFLWRINANLPKKGMIQIFNRSHYEEILFPVVHKALNKIQIKERQTVINQFEEHLQKSNTIILKFYLHISQKEQETRLEDRLTRPEKKWKYNIADKKESKRWDAYMNAYQNIFDGCTKKNQWIIVPSDQKWYRNFIVANTIVKTLKGLKMKYPE